MAKFPDLSGDGITTQKDILIGRGVIEKPKVKKMRLGGQPVEDTTKSIDLPMSKPKRIDAPSPMPNVLQQNKMNKSKIQQLKNLRNVSGSGAPKSRPR